MPGLSLTLQTAKSTLLNTQVQIQVTSQNIANAENKSYARQTAVLSTTPPTLSHGGWLGTGASVESIIQNRSQFIEQRLMAGVSAQSHQEALSTQLAVAQANISDNGSTGISGALDAFWSSWDTLVQNPGGVAEQAAVQGAAENLAQTVRSTYDRLNDQLSSLTGSLASPVPPGEIQRNVDRANDLLKRLADFNRQIMMNESPGRTANDLRDARYQAMRDLAEVMPIQFQEESNGSLTVSYSGNGGPVTLVSGVQAAAGPLQYDSATGRLTLNSFDGATSISTDTVSGGTLGGLLEARDHIRGTMDRLNDFASTLIGRVNTAYSPGPDVFQAGGDASNMEVVPGFLNGQDSAALAGRALAIAGLQNESVGFSGGVVTTRFSVFLSDIQRQVGSDVQDARTRASFQNTLVSELDAQQQSVSGVSLDEEMVDLMKHQQIYQAAAKIIQQTVEMLNTILEIA